MRTYIIQTLCILHLDICVHSGFEFQKQFEKVEEKMIVLVMGAVKQAYEMAGMNFDELAKEVKAYVERHK